MSDTELPALYRDLESAELACAGAGTIVDITACPGTDTCKLGIASSRGLAAELRSRLAARGAEMDEVIGGLRIKISGCFNSCGAHHVADLGFYGVSRNKYGYTVPHFQVVLGGQWASNAGSYGLAIGAVPSRRIPEAVDRITSRYAADREAGETFQAFIRRVGKAECLKMLDGLMAVPEYNVDASYYSDWGDPREFTTGDIGVGECAGAVVSAIEFQLVACEREVFEAQLQLERGHAEAAAQGAYRSMLNGAASLLRHRMIPFRETPDDIVGQFRTHFCDTQLFWDPFVHGAFAHHLFQAHQEAAGEHSEETAGMLVQKAQLFIEACHACYGRAAHAGGGLEMAGTHHDGFERIRSCEREDLRHGG